MPKNGGGGASAYLGPKGQRLEQAHSLHVGYIFRSIYRLAIAKPQVSINSKKNHQLPSKTSTGNGNLQPERESNEYSSSKNYWSSLLLEYYSSTRVLAAALT